MTEETKEYQADTAKIAHLQDRNRDLYKEIEANKREIAAILSKRNKDQK